MPATQATQATQECTEGDTHTQPCTQQQQHSSASPREWATLVCHADNRAIPLVKQSVLLGRGAFCDVSVPQKSAFCFCCCVFRAKKKKKP